MVYFHSGLLTGFFLISVAGSCIGVAVAQPVPEHQSDTVRIELRGRIKPQCLSSAIASQLHIGRLGADAAGGEKRIDFQLNCNAPFSFQISSAQGAFHMRKAAVRGGREAFLYRTRLEIHADDGGALVLKCDSAMLKAGGKGCIGSSLGRTAINRDAFLQVSWDQPGQNIAPGTYGDELQISFSLDQ